MTIDGGDGGSATAPLEMMSKIGLPIRESLVIVNDVLEEYGLRDEIKIWNKVKGKKKDKEDGEDE